MKRRGEEWTTAEIKAMMKMAEEGRTQLYVSRVLGRTPSAVNNAAHKFGVRFHSKAWDNVRPKPKLRVLSAADIMRKRNTT
jgi:hypothetical protein